MKKGRIRREQKKKCEKNMLCGSETYKGAQVREIKVKTGVNEGD